MAPRQRRMLSREDIYAKVRQKSWDAVGWANSKLSIERERVTRYMNSEWPRRNSEGSSTYVSADVYDSVRMQQAQLLETFAGGENIACFDPDSQMSVQECKVATDYATYVIFRKNDGYSVFQDVIYDGLTARAGIAKVYWTEHWVTSEENFDGLSEMQVTGLAAQPDVDSLDSTQDPQTGLYSGTLIRKTENSHVDIDCVAPEEFLIEPLARSIHTATYCGHRTPKTRAELIDMGHDPDVVMSLPADDAKELIFAPEVLARTHPTRAAETYDAPIEPALEYVVYYESYVRMDIGNGNGVKLYKVCHAGSQLLDDPEEVDKAPFLAYVPLPVPHIFYGDNFAQRVIPTQNARTVLMRGVLDHTAITTNARFQVVNGGLMNPRELLENRMGGIVNVRRPDSVAPITQQPLNPYVLQVLELLTDNNEKSTGISALSQGLNKDAISTQNSAALVDNMVRASAQRAKIMARNFAYCFLVPLMLEVIRLAILHVKGPEWIEVGGAPLQANVHQWTERRTCSISQHLGYGEKDQAAANLMQGYASMAQDPAIANMFGPMQRYAMLTDIAKLKNFHNFGSYLNPQAPPPQPAPPSIADQAKQAQAQASQMQAQTAQFKEQRLMQNDQQKVQLHVAETHLKAMDHDRTHDRQDIETAARIDTASRELELQRQLENKKLDNEATKIKPKP